MIKQAQHLDGPLIFDAELVEEPQAPSGAAGMHKARWTLVSLGSVLVTCVAGGGWIALERLAADPPGYRFAQSAEDADAARRLSEVGAQLDAERQALTRVAAAPAPPAMRPPSPWSQSSQARRQEALAKWQAEHPGASAAMLRILEPFLTLHRTGADFSRGYEQLASLVRTPEDKAAVQARLRRALDEKVELGRLAQLVAFFGDEPTRQAFLDTLSSPEAARARYALRDLEGVVSLVELFPEASDRMLPIALSLAGEMPATTRTRLALHVNAFEGDLSALAPFAHHPHAHVRALAHQRLGDEELWDAAWTALERDYDQALAAADWIAEQAPSPRRRDAVLRALQARLGLNKNGRYPAARAYCHWATPEQADSLLAMASSQAASGFAGEACGALARLDEPRLAETIARRSSDSAWAASVANEMRQTPQLARAVAHALSKAAPHSSHRHYFSALAEVGAAEDAAWMEDYAERLLDDPATARGELGRLVQLALRRLSGTAR